MKRFGKLALILLVSLSLAACGAKTDDKGDTPAEGKTYNIGVAIYQYNDNFMTVYREELEKYFGEVGAKDGNTYKIDMQDGKNDQANQTEQINNFIAQGKDLIIANLVDPTGADTIINLAKDADIPVVLINREPKDPETLNIWAGKTTYVGADATQSGYFQGEMILALADKGDIDQDGTINYITLLGDPGNVDAQQRTEYSIKALDDAGVVSNALASPYQADWDTAKGEQFTRQAIEQFGNKLEVVFANNDGMALGAVQAAQGAGLVVNKDIYVVGVDAIPDAMELLKEGTLTGTVLNDHFNQSHTAVDVAIKLLAGEDVSAYYWSDYVMVTSVEDAELSAKTPREETVDQVVERYSKR